MSTAEATRFEVVGEEADGGNVIVYEVRPPLPYHKYGQVTCAIDAALIDGEPEIDPMLDLRDQDSMATVRAYHQISVDEHPDHSDIIMRFTRHSHNHYLGKADQAVLREIVNAVITST